MKRGKAAAQDRGATRSVERASRWEAVLRDDDRTQALKIVRDLSYEVVKRMRADGSDVFSAHMANPSLGIGAAGVALFLAYAADALEDPQIGEGAVEAMERALKQLPSVRSNVSLIDGVVGVAWVVDHLAPWLGIDDDPNRSMDELVLRRLRLPAGAGSFDLVTGLVGLGVYLLARLPSAAADEGLQLIVRRLQECGVDDGGGLYWQTAGDSPPGRLPPFDKPHVDTGMAHGMGGVVALLGMLAAEPALSDAHDMLGRALQWVLAVRERDEFGPYFPSVVAKTTPVFATRCAWCYGDPGLAAALAVVGLRAGRAELSQIAHEHAEASAARAMAQPAVADPSFCHGLAGVAHLFNRLCQLTREDSLRVTAQEWYRRLMARQRTDGGLAGYEFRWGESNADLPGLLYGAAGVGLALLAGATDVEPAWDRTLLIS